MANKTIHELSPASTVSGSYEFAIYDTDGSTTKKATADQIFTASDLLYADDEDEPTGEVDFTSQDELNPSSSVSVDRLDGTDSWSQRFVKISQMFRNIRYLLKMLGTTSISSIGGGTVTGAISALNSDLVKKNKLLHGRANYSDLMPGGYNNRITVDITFPSSFSGSSYYAEAHVAGAYGDYPYIRCHITSKSSTGMTITLINSNSGSTKVNGVLEWIAYE